MVLEVESIWKIEASAVVERIVPLPKKLNSFIWVVLLMPNSRGRITLNLHCAFRGTGSVKESRRLLSSWTIPAIEESVVNVSTPRVAPEIVAGVVMVSVVFNLSIWPDEESRVVI
jgi:hypothetical protein